MLRKDKQTRVTLCDRDTARKLMNRKDFRRVKPLISCQDITPEQLQEVTPIEQEYDHDMVGASSLSVFFTSFYLQVYRYLFLFTGI